MTLLKTLIYLILSLFVTSKSFGQTDINAVIDSNLAIKRDARLDSLIMKHIRVNELKNGFDGYRLQLYSGSGTTARQEANTLRAEFLNRYPDIPAYVVYQAPNFKVRVGDYRTELEAIWLQRELAYKFPGGFVVKDLVKFPPLEIEKEVDEFDEFELLEENQKSSNGLERSDETPKKK